MRMLIPAIVCAVVLLASGSANAQDTTDRTEVSVAEVAESDCRWHMMDEGNMPRPEHVVIFINGATCPHVDFKTTLRTILADNRFFRDYAAEWEYFGGVYVVRLTLSTPHIIVR